MKAGPALELRNRPPLERMLRIHQALQAGKYPTGASLAAELEVSTKTIHRDLEFMRDRLMLPLEWNHARFGYHYTEEVSGFPTMQISEGELLALVIAEKALQQYRGTSFERPLVSAIRKIEHALPDTISISLSEFEQSISFRTRAEPILNLETFDKLTRATAGRQQLELQYRKPGQSAPESRIVDPYHLANINGEWFLFAYDHLRKDIRTFAPARMVSLKPTGKTFPKPQKFSLEKRLRDSFGVQSGQGSFDVVIRFNARAADFIREKKWHQSEQRRDLADGGLELSLKLSSLDEVERWILSWGGNAKALQPKELVERIRASAQRLLDSVK